MSFYPWALSFHLIAMIAWMAGMLYLPRLYVYHAQATPGSEASETFKVMEKRLLRLIINPAMIATLLFGLWLLALNPHLLHERYMHAKFGLVVMLFALHGFFARARKDFEKDQNRRSVRFWKTINEVPALLLAVIVLLVILKPF
ncbi:MAG: protoporphyrinogen oxidase HemJ [Proteobacteria bacterium]|nr:protoporphyrinogen oxidase HemJ [Pseudomonadota bacterium]